MSVFSILISGSRSVSASYYKLRDLLEVVILRMVLIVRGDLIGEVLIGEV